MDTLLKLVYSLAVLALTWIAYHIARGVLQARTKDQTHMHTLRMLVRNTFFSASALIVLVMRLDVGGHFTIAMGVLGAGIAFASQAVFADPVYNYTQHWHYLWDETMIPITYASNWQRAGEVMLEHGQTYSTHLQAQAQAELRQMVARYLVPDTPVEPALYIVMTDNWIEMTLRYVVEARERRQVKGKLHRELLQHFEAQPDITVASATFEIVGFPSLQVHDHRQGAAT